MDRQPNQNIPIERQIMAVEFKAKTQFRAIEVSDRDDINMTSGSGVVITLHGDITSGERYFACGHPDDAKALVDFVNSQPSDRLEAAIAPKKE